MYLLGVVLIALGVGASIAVHEIGHLVLAKTFRVKCTQYMVGFGPTLWSRRRGETEYGLKAVPLGGYVRMIGMFPPRSGDDGRLRASSTGRWSQLAEQARQESMEEIGPADQDRVFYKLPVWKRLIIMLAGPAMNLVIATVLLTGMITVLGLPQNTAKISEVAACAPSDVTATDCAGAGPSPAAAAGLQPGDRIVSINGQGVQGWALTSYAIQNAGQTATIVVDRDGTQQTLTAQLVQRERPQLTPDGSLVLDASGQPVNKLVGYLGATGSIEFVTEPITQAPGVVGSALVGTAEIFLKLPEKLVGVFQAAFNSGDRDQNGPMSVVGIGRVAGEVTAGDLGAVTDSWLGKAVFLLSLLASLNIALFVFNMIPLLPMDGGHMAGALWEGVKRGWSRIRGLPEPHPVDTARALPLAYSVAICLIAMTLLLVYADLVNPIRLGG